jgi:uncharacterized membrane protein
MFTPSHITAFGALHTLISLAALGCGIVAFARYGAIGTTTGAGKSYVWLTVLSCVTGLFIFHHGGFGKPHALSIITLMTLAIAWVAEARSIFGSASRYVATVGYSLSFFFHMIPTFTEGSTRLPPGHPLASSPDDPNLQLAIGAAFTVFLIGATVQVLRLRRRTP